MSNRIAPSRISGFHKMDPAAILVGKRQVRQDVAATELARLRGQA